jgi:hypothetical protein
MRTQLPTAFTMLAVMSANHVHGLEAAAHREVEQQREQADGQSVGVGNRERENDGIDVHTAKQIGQQPHGCREDGSERDAEVNAVD